MTCQGNRTDDDPPQTPLNMAVFLYFLLINAKKIALVFVSYFIVLLQNFTLIHVGTYLDKIEATVKVGLLISPFIFAMGRFNLWIHLNIDYITVVLGAIAVDHILGTIKHGFFFYDFTIKKNLVGLMTKIGLVIACGFLFEGLNILVHKDSVIKDYLTITTRIIVFLYPAGSAFSSSSVISGGKFPPTGWMEKLRRFQTNLDTNSFKNPNNPEL